MQETSANQEYIKISVEKIIDLLRQVRNDLIQDFLNDQYVKNYFVKHYDKELSAVKLEFLKRDLKELLNAPIDLAHYASLIKQIRESNTADLSIGNDQLFFEEMGVIFKKYIY